MGDKIKKIYDALIEGAGNGLSADALFQHVIAECPSATSKKIVKASLLALSDEDVKDANILQVVYALAIKHRLDPVSEDDIEEASQPAEEMPKVKKTKAPKVSEAPIAG
jgi:hypothetical protein